MFNKLKDRFFEWPWRLDQRLRWSDFRQHRTAGTWLHRLGFIEGYSKLALWLPIPVIIVFAYGLPKWRGWTLLAVCLTAILAHLLICRICRERWLPRLSWLLLGLVAASAFLLAPGQEGKQHEELPYAHLFGAFGFLALTLGMPASRKLADWLIGRQLPYFRQAFARHLEKTQLFVTPPDPRRTSGDDATLVEKRGTRLLRSYALVPFSSILMLVIIPAMLVVLADPGWEWRLGISGLVVWWVLLSFAHYHDRLKMFRMLVREALLAGGTAVVSLFVIIFAATRLAGVSYVTTVLDQRSRWPVVLIILIFYLIFWLYDYWRERAAAEVMLGLLHEGADRHPTSIAYGRKPNATLSIHGAGRMIAACPDPEKGFESYRPLEVFQQIVTQLECRARTKETLWKDYDMAYEALDSLREKGRLYHAIPAVVMVLAVALGFSHVNGLEQSPGLNAVSVERGSFDLGERLRESPGRQTYYAVAASGGGTRAALYSYAVLRALRDNEVLDRVVLLSSVSGGSAGVAYFAAHRQQLLDSPTSEDAWARYRNALAEDHIKRVLFGVGEWRFMKGERLGSLLTESFDDEFYSEDYPPDCTTIGCARVGLMFNTAVAGAFRTGERNSAACLKQKGKKRECGTVDRTGSRLVITNLDSVTEASLRTLVDGWPLDFDYEVVGDPGAPLTSAASMSANFPPVFSNTAVQIDQDSPEKEKRYWVTDGGAVENRGLISLLLALRAETRAWSGDASLPSLKILVADASGTSVAYGEDRGIGAASAAKRQIADKLVAELTLEVKDAWQRLSQGRATVEVVHLPMPEVLRSGFGTHWQMPAKVKLKNPETWYLHGSFGFGRSVDPIKLNQEQIMQVVNLLFAEDRTADGIDPMLWEWIEAGLHGDPRCELFRAVDFDSESCP